MPNDPVGRAGVSVVMLEHFADELTGREEGFVKDGRLQTGCQPVMVLTDATVRRTP